MKIFGTSMIEGNGNKKFNFYLERCHAELKSYPRATAKELKHNIQLPIQIDKPDIVVIYDGCNDISPEKSIPKKFWCHKRYLTESPTFDPTFHRYSASVFQNWYKIHFLLHFHVCCFSNE